MIKETIQIFDLDNNPRKNVSYETMDKIIGAYNPKDEHQAPITIGHAQHDSPSYGLVGKMFRKGKDVFANVSYIPEFVEMVKKGLYKFVSIAFTRKYKSKKGETPYLRHLAFTPIPAIKGMKTTKLAPVTFADDFEDYEDLGEFEFNSKETKKKEYYMDKEAMNALIDSRVAKELETVKAKLETEFSDQVTTLETDVKDLKDQNKKKDTEITKLNKSADDFTDQTVEGRIDVLIAAGIKEPADKDELIAAYQKYKEKGASDLYSDILDKLEEEADKKIEPGSHFNKKKDVKRPKEKKKDGDMDEEEQKFHDDLNHSKGDIEKYANMDSFSIVNVGMSLKEKVN